MKIDSAYHECGHVIISKLFNDLFRINFITINLDVSAKHDPKSLGGMNGKLKKPANELTILDHDSLILIFLAGMCTDDLIRENFKINDVWYSIPCYAQKLNMDEYSGDSEFVQNQISFIDKHINSKHAPYIIESLKFLHQIICSKEIRETLEMLRKSLIESSNKTLNENEINEIINQSPFNDWLLKNKDHLCKEREQLLNQL